MARPKRAVTTAKAAVAKTAEPKTTEVKATEVKAEEKKIVEEKAAAKKAVKESQKEFTKKLASYADCYVNLCRAEWFKCFCCRSGSCC